MRDLRYLSYGTNTVEAFLKTLHNVIVYVRNRAFTYQVVIFSKFSN